MANTSELSRRSLVRGGAAAFASTAISWSRVQGANDRISMAQVGVGARGRELASVVAGLMDRHNVEMTAICDLWSVNRERAAKAAASAYANRALSNTWRTCSRRATSTP